MISRLSSTYQRLKNDLQNELTYPPGGGVLPYIEYTTAGWQKTENFLWPAVTRSPFFCHPALDHILTQSEVKPSISPWPIVINSGFSVNFLLFTDSYAKFPVESKKNIPQARKCHFDVIMTSSPKFGPRWRHYDVKMTFLCLRNNFFGFYGKFRIRVSEK